MWSIPGSTSVGLLQDWLDFLESSLLPPKQQPGHNAEGPRWEACSPLPLEHRLPHLMRLGISTSELHLQRNRLLWLGSEAASLADDERMKPGFHFQPQAPPWLLRGALVHSWRQWSAHSFPSAGHRISVFSTHPINSQLPKFC